MRVDQYVGVVADRHDGTDAGDDRAAGRIEFGKDRLPRGGARADCSADAAARQRVRGAASVAVVALEDDRSVVAAEADVVRQRVRIGRGVASVTTHRSHSGSKSR